MTDWTGNQKSTFVTLGASNHTAEERQSRDYYATDPIAAERLCDLIRLNSNIWECACGEGHLSEALLKHGYDVYSTDIIDRGYKRQNGCIDFLKCSKQFNGDIVTNPPYKFAQAFVEKALKLIPTGNKVAMFLKILFLEGKKRQQLFKQGSLKYVYVSSSRITCAKNGDFKNYNSGAVAYAWFIWEKGYKGEPIIRWF